MSSNHIRQPPDHAEIDHDGLFVYNVYVVDTGGLKWWYAYSATHWYAEKLARRGLREWNEPPKNPPEPKRTWRVELKGDKK